MPLHTRHRFDSTGEAYDASQTDESIRNGDILIVESEGVVGFLCDAWPAAVTRRCGEFHSITDESQMPVSSLAQAKDEARKMYRRRRKVAELARELRAIPTKHLTRHEKNISVHANLRSYARTVGTELRYPSWGPLAECSPDLMERSWLK